MTLREAEPFAVGYLEADRDDIEYRTACGFREYARHTKIEINTDDRFQGLAGSWGTTGIRFSRTEGIIARKEDFIRQKELFPELEGELKSLYDAMIPLDFETRLNSLLTENEKKLAENKCCWGAGGGHSNPDYELLLRLGTNGIKARIERFRKIHTDKNDFYDSLLLCLEAVEILAARYKEAALKELETAGQNDAVILRRLVSAFENIPQNKPRNFFEACQMFWLTFSFLDTDSPGLFDYTMGEYYQNDDKADRYECLKKLWELFKRTRTWNLCISGSDEYGNVFENNLTTDVLRVAREFRYDTPNITMRMSENTPESLWREAAETLATGIGMPAIYNDECVCTALEAVGISASDSHKYCMNGCNQIDIFGKSHMGLEDGEVSVIKALEFALFGGVCQLSGEKIGLDTGDAASFESFTELWDAFIKQLDFLADTVVSISNRCQKEFSVYGKNPWRSALTQGCIEKGRDMKDRGVYYGHGQILTEGLPDTADCLAAVKHYVFDEKKYSMQTLLDALKNDFYGYDGLYRDFSTYHKFGNEFEDTDKIYEDISEHFYRYLQTKQTWRGGVFGAGCSTFHRAPNYGLHCGALPNGKKKGETLLADSIGATPGCDKSGPTALLNSVLRANQRLALSGNVMQMKFQKNQFGTPTGMAAFISLAKTYFRMGGQTLQINVVSKEELADAKIHPEKHENLIVRVGGYSAYFTELAVPLQDNIIARTENMM